jgi:hypothetical protein
VAVKRVIVNRLLFLVVLFSEMRTFSPSFGTKACEGARDAKNRNRLGDGAHANKILQPFEEVTCRKRQTTGAI